MAADPKHLVRTSTLDPGAATTIRHPFNPNSEVRVQRLGDRTGLARLAVSLARVPPGRESFVLHSHLLQEEFLYILEGTGTAVIGDAEVAVGPGDFMGFPTDGTPHTLKNTGDVDLVYLMAGERSPPEVAHFPTVGKTVVYSARDGIRAFDDANARHLTLADFVAKD